jgi:hypothetical protein
MCPKKPPPGRAPPSSLASATTGHITDQGTEQPLHRRLDCPVPRERAARQGADRAGHRATEDHARAADAACRSRRAAARQAGRVSARGPRDHENALASVHLQRQPLLRVELQDPEVPARVPRPVRLDRARPGTLPIVRALVQPRPPSLGHRPDDTSRRPPRPGTRAARRPRTRPRRRLRPQPGTVRAQRAGPARATDRRLDQQAEGGRHRSLNSTAKRLTGLDNLRKTLLGQRQPRGRRQSRIRARARPSLRQRRPFRQSQVACRQSVPANRGQPSNPREAGTPLRTARGES